MKNKIKIFILFTIIILYFFSHVHAEITVKIRDIADIDGLKENQVYGFGLVVGLQGTGDSKSLLIQTSLQNLLKNLGLADDQNYKSKNIAAVLLTAKLPPFVRIGDRVNVSVSSIGDAKSLAGGTLIQSPLRGADGINYVVAQGPLSLRAVSGGVKAVKTDGNIVNGGIIEKEIIPEFVNNNTVGLILKNWDFTEAINIIKIVSEKYPASNPAIENGGKINMTVPAGVKPVEFISEIENLEITPSFAARVVINESDGTIVMGKDVKISESVISKEGLTVKIAGGTKVNVASISEAATVKDLVESLNYVGASTRDIIAILKALKDAGALHANLIVR
ncbi:MAG: flagellar basal body P-ring protein FlgI [Spirochaetes bacterium]|nr:flagellar basal body P-ring protein FlgI [Spirochaetota bacterium]